MSVWVFSFLLLDVGCVETTPDNDIQSTCCCISAHSFLILLPKKTGLGDGDKNVDKYILSDRYGHERGLKIKRFCGIKISRISRIEEN